MYYTIYKTTNILNGMFYVGKHVAKRRWDDVYVGTGKWITAAIREHGKNNFKKEVLVMCSSQDEMDLLEKELITEDWLNKNKGKVYNINIGGEGQPAGSLHPRYGKPQTQFNKETTRKANLGNKYNTGKIWITNGVHNKRALSTDLMLDGYSKGFTIILSEKKINQLNRLHIDNVGKKRSLETKMKISAAKRKSNEEYKRIA